LERNELILVQTDNDDFIDYALSELLFGWISPDYESELKVIIESIDDLDTHIDFLDASQRYAIPPGGHKLNMSCQLTIKRGKDPKDQEIETNYNEDVVQIDLRLGHKYLIQATSEGSSCGFKIKELKIKK